MSVYLVGAGPGDPDLLTRKGARLLAAADVIVVDRLVDPRLLEEVRDDAIVLHVGKHARDGNPTVEQATINDMLIRYGASHDIVVRLKGGDPYLFGRGGEEMLALRDAGINVEVVPGVSSAFSVPALAGIPVTFRQMSTAVTVVSGHDVESGALDWHALAKFGGTIVALMAVANRKALATALQEGGMSSGTPVATIESGSTPRERRTATTLGALGDIALVAPAIIVIGDVALFLANAHNDAEYAGVYDALHLSKHVVD